MHPEVLELFKAHTPPDSFRSIRSIQLNRYDLGNSPVMGSPYVPERFFVDRHGNPHLEEGSEGNAQLGFVIFDLL